MQLAERVFEDVLALDVHGQILAADAGVGALQLGAEVAPLDVEVQDARVIHQHCEWTVGQMRRRLAENLLSWPKIIINNISFDS